MVAVTHFDGFLETSYFDVQCCSFLFGLITLVLGLGQVQPQDVALFTDLKKTNEEIKVLISISNKSIKIHVYVFFLLNIYENCTNPFDWSRQYSLVQITKNTNIFQLSFHQKELFLTLMTISWINYQIN